jgi:hypothetical protein
MHWKRRSIEETRTGHFCLIEMQAHVDEAVFVHHEPSTGKGKTLESHFRFFLVV